MFELTMRWLVVVVLSSLTAGCSLQNLAIDRIGNVLAAGGTTFAADDDPDLVGEALPFSLKLIESLIAERPEHRGLLLAAASGFAQYSYGWVDLKASALQGSDLAASEHLDARAKRLYLRARDYGLRGLAISRGPFERQLRAETASALAGMRRDDVPLLYWTASAWALAIAKSKDDPETVADLPIVEAMIRRAQALDPDWGEGAIDSLLVAWEAAHDERDAARSHFDRAVRLSGGKLASPYVTLAESVCVATQQRAEFRRLLEQALAVDPAARPEWRMQNLIAQRRAAWLLAHADDLFLEEETP